MAALLLLFLFFVTFLGTAALVRRTQERIALQSRLDICAVKVIQRRKNLLKEVTELNRTIRATVYAVYVARGLILVTGPAGKAFFGLGEKGLVKLNQTLAKWQDARVKITAGLELLDLYCRPTPYSDSPAFCRATPKLGGNFSRERPLFPDLFGAKVLLNKAGPLARVSCRGEWDTRTELALEGDSDLKNAKFQDRYEK